jgi:hypothetical protein
VSERPWWHSGQGDKRDEPLPAVVILEPDYGAELPLTSAEEGMLGWQQTGFSPQLLDQLADWQEAFEAGFHYGTGWCSLRLRDEWARQASELEGAVRAELGSHAELVVHLWPLRDDEHGRPTPHPDSRDDSGYGKVRLERPRSSSR